jgi:uncharacterized membrane protein HdeD (DUF308 family)
LPIGLPFATSVGIVILLAWLILFAGVCHLIFAFQSTEQQNQRIKEAADVLRPINPDIDAS